MPNGGKPDDVLVVLGLHIVSLNTNFVKLKRRDLVEKAQLRYLKLLRNYLTFKLKDHAKATAKFVEVMRVISYAMEASEILTKRLPFWNIFLENPDNLLSIFYSSDSNPGLFELNQGHSFEKK